jgi:uncharacterized protein (DUF2267 family)
MVEKSILVERILERAGLSSTKEASLSLMATLAALGERLDEEPRALLAAALPEELGAVVLERLCEPSCDLEELIDRVRLHEGVSVGFAREHAQVVCRVLGELFSEEARTRFGRMVPQPFMEMFEPPPSGAEPPIHAPKPVEERTIATGRPGARHPLSESRPRSGQGRPGGRRASAR